MQQKENRKSFKIVYKEREIEPPKTYHIVYEKREIEPPKTVYVEVDNCKPRLIKPQVRLEMRRSQQNT